MLISYVPQNWPPYSLKGGWFSGKTKHTWEFHLSRKLMLTKGSLRTCAVGHLAHGWTIVDGNWEWMLSPATTTAKINPRRTCPHTRTQVNRDLRGFKKNFSPWIHSINRNNIKCQAKPCTLHAFPNNSNNNNRWHCVKLMSYISNNKLQTVHLLTLKCMSRIFFWIRPILVSCLISVSSDLVNRLHGYCLWWY